MTAPTITLLWQRQSVWSQAAGGLKAQVGRARVTALVLTVAGALLGAASAGLLAGHLMPGRILAAGACVTLALASFAVRGASPEMVRDWTRARSVSEALKSDVYCYLAGAGPFRADDRDGVALRRLEELAGSVGDLLKYTAGVEPVDRPLPPVRDVDTYVDVRVQDQISRYYRPRALRMAVRVRLARRLEVSLGAIAAALGALVAVFPAVGVSAWIGVLTTVATAIAAHASTSRYEHQQIEFTRTADELERLSARRGGHGVDPLGDDEFVQACERVISIENEGWMAKLGLDDEKA